MVIIAGKNIREFVGKVVSNKMDKTLVVEVEKVKIHPIYKKRYTIKKKYYVHDEKNTAQEWDYVRIRQTRPLSRLKRWRLIEIVQKWE